MNDSKDHAKFLKKNTHKLVKDLLSEHYHGLTGTWSSSQFKDLLDDEEIFIRKYIKKEIPRVEREAFDTGTYFHTGVLEPHKMADEIAVYDKKVRRGKDWEKFKAKHPGKMIITMNQKIQGDLMIEAVKGSPTAQIYLEGEPEVSLFVQLVVFQGNIYAPAFNKVLTVHGWESANHKAVDSGYPMIVKVRADTLGEDFVSDLKSTKGNARSEKSIREAISGFKYDLSAALYLDIFSLVRPTVETFVWIFASKGVKCAQAWRASNSNIMIGRAKYMRAMLKLADCAQSNWEIVDCLREAEPLPHEREWLRLKDTDLL